MIDRTARATRLAASVFVVSTTLGQVIAIDNRWIQIMILLPNLLSWIYVLYCNKKYRHFSPTKRQITKVSDLLKDTHKIRFRHVKDDVELHLVWEIDTMAYGVDNFNFDHFKSWWTRYPYSPFALVEGNEILGSFGLWPLKEEVFSRIKESIIPEEMITFMDIVSPESVSECVYWYFAGIPIRTERDIFHQYLAEALRDWISRLGDHRLIHCVALRYTTSDENLFKALGFTKYKSPMREGMFPVFYRSFEGRDEIQEYIIALQRGHDDTSKESAL
jgi:hypothetical protein